MEKPKKQLTDKQTAFLEHLLGDARGNVRLAMDLAGYAKTTSVQEVVGNLRDEIMDRTSMMMALNAPKAAFGITDVLDDPSAMGAKNAIAAARALDLYKADTGRRKTTNKKSVAAAVGRTSSSTPGIEGKAKFSESQVAKMSDRDYEKNEEAIMEAMRSRAFVYDISGLLDKKMPRTRRGQSNRECGQSHCR